ncbi:DUF3027 domain-containing protein [Leucobacter sp. OH2974_COT-288]|nr:DUF3027 domain-containing protein [Leucobacter sp. OH2974_COT-288]
MTELKGKALREAERLARGELVTVTAADTIGDLLEIVQLSDGGSCNLVFDCLKPSYVGWRWVVTVTRLSPKAAVTVTELGLLPGPDALLAPEWVPWSQRLADYRKSQAAAASDEALAAAQAAQELAAEDIDAEDDLLENDFSDFDDEINGVDIDSVDLDTLADVLFANLDPVDQPAPADADITTESASSEGAPADTSNAAASH